MGFFFVPLSWYMCERVCRIYIFASFVFRTTTLEKTHIWQQTLFAERCCLIINGFQFKVAWINYLISILQWLIECAQTIKSCLPFVSLATSKESPETSANLSPLLLLGGVMISHLLQKGTSLCITHKLWLYNQMIFISGSSVGKQWESILFNCHCLIAVRSQDLAAGHWQVSVERNEKYNARVVLCMEITFI